MRTDELRGPVEKGESERLNRLKRVEDRAFARGGAAHRPGLDLKVRQQVVRQDHQLLPRTVGGVGHGRHRVKREAALQLRDGLLVIAPATGKPPEIGEREIEVARHRGVLVVPVIRVKEIQLIVLRRAVVDVFAVDRHPHRAAPGRGRVRHDEAGDIWRDGLPRRLRADVLLQIQPVVERDFDRVAGPACREPLQHILAKKRAIHPKADGPAARQQRAQLGPQVAQERQTGLAVVDIARPILHAQHVRRFRQVRHDRVITRDLPVMRVESPEGSLDLPACRHHHAVHIDGPRAEAQRRQHARDHRGVDLLQPLDAGHRERLQPAAERAGRRHDVDLAEPPEQGIVLNEGHVPQTPAAHDQQPDQQADHRHGPEVAPRGESGKRGAHDRIEARGPQIPAEQLQPGIRGERDVPEFQRQIPIDSCAQIGSASSHVWWPFVVAMEEWVAPSFNHNGRPLSISK